jgi:fibronectin-binding autotransporter adhesin
MFTRRLSRLPDGRSRRNTQRTRLTVEALEDRYVPSTLTVTSALDDGSAGTLRAQIAAAAPGDVLVFDPSLNGQTITLTQGEIDIAKSLTIQGPGANQLIVSGNNASRVFNIDGPGVLNVAIGGLTLTGGNGTNVTVPPPSAPDATVPTSTVPGTFGGGAIRIDNETVTLLGVTISSNHSDGGPGGGILNQAGALTVRDCRILANTTGTAGGGIANGSGALTIVNTMVRSNTATTDGGGIASDSGAVTLQSANVRGNTSGGTGGGVTLNNPTRAVLVDTTTIANNTATGDGGGVFVGSASGAGFTLQRSVITGNKTDSGRGGGVALFLKGGTGPVTLAFNSVDGNTAATQGGGGILLDGAGATGAVLIRSSSVSGNHAGDGTGDHGGGLLISDAGASVTVQNTTIAGNSAADSGGGIFEHHTGGSFRVLSSTIASNRAAGSGGGIQVDSGATLTQLESTIVADNTAGAAAPDVANAGTLVVANNNLVENGFAGTAPSTQSGNIVGQDPGLGLLQNNGGPTPTLAPLASSPVLDTGSNPTGATYDQRGPGFARTVGAQTDIGAVEVDLNAPSATLVSAPAVNAGSTPGSYDFQVAFDDNRGVRLATLGSAVSVTGPNGFSQVATLVSADGTIDNPRRVATYRITPPGGVWADTANGTYTISIQPNTVKDFDGNVLPAGSLGTFAVSIVAPAPPPRPKQFYAVGADTNNPPVVRVYDAATGELEWTVTAYAANYRGGVRVAVADIDGDGTPDLITAPGADPNVSPLVKVFSGATHDLLAQFMAYDLGFHGGVFVATGDVNGDGHPDIITGADAGAFPHVKVFNGVGLSEMYSFYAFAPDYAGGVRVAAGDVNGDGRADIIVGAGTVPHVRVFSGADLSELYSFMAYDPAFAGGVFIAAGDLDGDGHADIITGADAGGNGHVKAFNGGDLSLRASFLAFGAGYQGAVHVGTADVNDNGLPDILVGAGHPAGPHLKAFAGRSLFLLDSFLALPSADTGIFVS